MIDSSVKANFAVVFFFVEANLCGCLPLRWANLCSCLPLGVGTITEHHYVRATGRLPDFLVVGAARCGTTWLARNLALHPDVFVPRCKEVHFFDRHFGKGIDWYKSFFAGRRERRVGEATPRYLSAENVPALIHRYVPDASIVIVIRDPVDRVYSHYWNLVFKARKVGYRYRKSFEEKVSSSMHLISEGFYAEQIDRYRQLFPRNNIKTMVHDDLVREPAAFLREVYRFLAIDADFQSSLAECRINAAGSKLGRSMTLFRLYAGLLRLRLNRVGKWIDGMNWRAVPPMKHETRAMLLNRHYLQEIERLEQMLDRDLSAWKQ